MQIINDFHSSVKGGMGDHGRGMASLKDFDFSHKWALTFPK